MTIDPGRFVQELHGLGVQFFSGVPDSILKNLCSHLADCCPPEQHVIAADEGGALAMCVGYHLATGEVPCVYLQNAGLGNLVNPLLSLADETVYSIPMVLLIGWRGKPGVDDEPQHRKQGRATLPMLDAMDVPYVVLEPGDDTWVDRVGAAVQAARERGAPSALVVSKGAFTSHATGRVEARRYALTREAAVRLVVDSLGPRDVLVSTTGGISRELYEYRDELRQPHTDFLNVGAMGHASQIALGIALRKPDRLVYCLDGDGSMLMHLGALAIAGVHGGSNLKHVLVNNGAHQSVGGQETVGFLVSFPDIARACGYRYATSTEDREQAVQLLGELREQSGPGFLEIQVALTSRKDLGRPSLSPGETKRHVMRFLGAR